MCRRVHGYHGLGSLSSGYAVEDILDDSHPGAKGGASVYTGFCALASASFGL